jgi:hypothetical protein
MPQFIEFTASCRYASADGIEAPTELSVGTQRIGLMARLDAGAAHCVFERRYAEELGLDVESGRAQRFRTMAGSFVAYEHEVTVHTLGRTGWLDRLRVGIVDYDRLLLLGNYGE